MLKGKMYFSLTICVPPQEHWCQQRKHAKRREPRIYAAVTHGLCVGNALQKIEASPIEVLLMSNTIQDENRFANTAKVKTVSVANLFGQAIHCICRESPFHPYMKETAARKRPNFFLTNIYHYPFSPPLKGKTEWRIHETQVIQKRRG